MRAVYGKTRSAPLARHRRAVLADAFGRGVDISFLIYKGETFEIEKLFNLPLVASHMVQIAQVLVGQHPDGHIDHIDIVIQIILNNLLPAACQFIQVQVTDGFGSFRSVFMGAAGQQEHPADENAGQEDDADDRCQDCSVSAFLFHAVLQ